MSNPSRGQVDSKISSLINDLSELRGSLADAKARRSGLLKNIHDEQNRLSYLEEKLEQLRIDLEIALEEESYDYDDDYDDDDGDLED